VTIERQHDAGPHLLAMAGERTLHAFAEVGGVFLLLGRLVTVFPRLFRDAHLLAVQMVRVGVESLPLVILTSLFTGGVAAIQAAYQFQGYVPMRYLGTVIGKSVVMELGPVLTALVVGGRVSASIAAEIGTMRVTEQVDALETMAIDPVRYLVLPRFAASAVMLPVVTVFANLVAILGGGAVAVGTLDVSRHTYAEGLHLFFQVHDVAGGLVKALVFGMVIATMGCYHGFRCQGGAEGVGRATMRAVVDSCVLILVTNYLLGVLLFRFLFG
jgi:phospholipid/cholesterol/gamma-HCH transport system permease protein